MRKQSTNPSAPQSENRQFLDKVHYRHFHEIKAHQEYAQSLSLRDTDPNVTDFSDVIKNSSLVMLKKNELDDVKATNLLRSDAMMAKRQGPTGKKALLPDTETT
mmetsp:Transcript_22226/g.34399  ORF Transcript_22226/g.34399 Transcript_22226/m.34399 type:complete len:104 (-) Transcript_22226:514-825(-)